MASKGNKWRLGLCFLAISLIQIPRSESNTLQSLQKSRHHSPLVLLLNNDDGNLQSVEHSNEGRGSQWHHDKHDYNRHDHSNERYYDKNRYNRHEQKRNDHRSHSSVYDKHLPYVDNSSGDDSQSDDYDYFDVNYRANRENQQRRRDRQRRGENDDQMLSNTYDNKYQKYGQYGRKGLDHKKELQRYLYKNNKRYRMRSNRLTQRLNQAIHQNKFGYRGDSHRGLNRDYSQKYLNKGHSNRNNNREDHKKDNYKGKYHRNDYNDAFQRDDYRGDLQSDSYRGYAKIDVNRKPRRGRNYNDLRARLDDLKNREQYQQVQRNDQDQYNQYQNRLQVLRSRLNKNLQNLERSPVKYLLRAADDLDCAAQLECIKLCFKQKYRDLPKKAACQENCQEAIQCKGDDEDEDLCNESGGGSCEGQETKTGSTKGVILGDIMKDDC